MRLLLGLAMIAGLTLPAVADDRRNGDWDRRTEREEHWGRTTDRGGDKERRKARKEWYKERRKAAHEREKDRREAWREDEKDRREAWHESEKDRREWEKERRKR